MVVCSRRPANSAAPPPDRWIRPFRLGCVGWSGGHGRVQQPITAPSNAAHKGNAQYTPTHIPTLEDSHRKRPWCVMPHALPFPLPHSALYQLPSTTQQLHTRSTAAPRDSLNHTRTATQRKHTNHTPIALDVQSRIAKREFRGSNCEPESATSAPQRRPAQHNTTQLQKAG